MSYLAFFHIVSEITESIPNISKVTRGTASREKKSGMRTRGRWSFKILTGNGGLNVVSPCQLLSKTWKVFPTGAGIYLPPKDPRQSYYIHSNNQIG